MANPNLFFAFSLELREISVKREYKVAVVVHVVSGLAFYSDDMSSNTAQVFCFYLLKLFKKNQKKRSRDGLIKQQKGMRLKKTAMTGFEPECSDV